MLIFFAIILNLILFINGKYVCIENSTIALVYNEIVFFETLNYPAFITIKMYHSCITKFVLKDQNQTVFKLAKEHRLFFGYAATMTNDPHENIQYLNADYFTGALVSASKNYSIPQSSSDEEGYMSQQGFVMFDDGTDNCPLETLCNPYSFNDETEVVYLYLNNIRNFYNLTDSCQWKFSAPSGYGFKIVITNIDETSQILVTNSTDVIINKRSLERQHPIYNGDNFIQINWFNLEMSNIENFLIATVSIVKKQFNYLDANCKIVKVDNQTIYWTNFYPPYNGFQNNVRCTYNLTIPNNTAVSLAPVVWGLETNVDVLQFYRNKNDVVQIPESLHKEASVYLLEPNYDGIEKNVLLEFKSDGSILSSIFSLQLTFLDCKCISHIYCNASLFQGILETNNPLYCGYLKCNITILPCSTAYGHMNLNVNIFDHNTLFDVLRIISNGEIVLQIDNSNRGFVDEFEVYLNSSNTNMLEAITSPSLIAGHFYVTYEPFDLPPSDLHIYLTTSSPYYFIDFQEHNLTVVEICDTLKSRNLSIVVNVVRTHEYLDVTISNNESLSYNLKGGYHCFSDYFNYASYKCKIKRNKIALFEPSKQNIVAVALSGAGTMENCIFSEIVYHTTFSNVSALSKNNGNCDIIFLVESAHVITMLWTTAVRENVKVFAGFDKTKLYFEFNSISAKTWKSIVLLSPFYIIEIPKGAALLIEAVRYESTVIPLDYPYSSLLATPDFGSSNLVDAINITYHGSTTLKFTAIYSNTSATNSSFYFHSIDSNMTDIISDINKTGDSITFHNSVVDFVYIAANFISLVNEGAIFLIETIKTEE